MAKITTDQIAAAYGIASAVYDGKLSAADGVRQLHVEFGLNPGSAGDFIHNFRRLLEGREFHRTLSLEAMDYFLGRIEMERGPMARDNAVTAFYAHLDYYAKLPKGSSQPSLRALADRWAAKHSSLPDLGAMQTQFEQAVKRSQSDAPTAREARLGNAPKYPQKVKVATEVYVRNPDVAGVVLSRAQGICERCEKPAPFIRRSDGTPYLEVHHRQHLADGGEDSVENAIALCPNCHREMHFGV